MVYKVPTDFLNLEIIIVTKNIATYHKILINIRN